MTTQISAYSTGSKNISSQLCLQKRAPLLKVTTRPQIFLLKYVPIVSSPSFAAFS